MKKSLLIFAISPLLFSCTIALTPRSSSYKGNTGGWTRTYPEFPLIERSYDEYLELTDQELLDYATFGAKMPSSFYGLEDLMPYQFMRETAVDEADAIAKINERFPGYHTQYVESRKETPLYWIHEVTYDIDDPYCHGSCTYSTWVLTMKSSVCLFEYPIQINDAMSLPRYDYARAALDIYAYSQIAEIGGHRFLASKIDEETSTYCNLQIENVYGDWGMQDEASLVKRTWTFNDDKSTATLTSIKTIQSVRGEVDLYEYPA